MANKMPTIEAIRGFRVGAVRAGIKASGALDMGLIQAEERATAAGVFTRNTVVSPSVTLTRKHLKSAGGYARAVLVSSGNANACTGRQGHHDARECAGEVARLIGTDSEQVLVATTGIIGHALPMDVMTSGISQVVAKLGSSRQGAFSRAIMTTDTRPKSAGMRTRGYSVAGVAKGSGMIAPNMATMLGFILTDATILPAALRAALKDVVTDTFNAVTVDGDCSTNDTVLVLASNHAKERISRPSGKAYSRFREALRKVCASLAEQIAVDGEGATKLIRVKVRGAGSVADARKVARTVGESALV